MGRPTGAYRADVPSFTTVAGSWPVQLGLTVVMVLVACWLMDLSMRGFTGQWRRERRRRPVRFRAPLPRTPPAEPRRRALQAVAADLRRLRRELALVSTGASAAHRAGLQAAYDDLLVEAAEALDVPHRLRQTVPGEAREMERLRLGTALTDAGLVLGDPGARG